MGKVKEYLLDYYKDQIMEDIMKTAQAPDTRPALAFDTQEEVYLIQQALLEYKNHLSAFHKEKVSQIVDQVDLIIEMFNGKE